MFQLTYKLENKEELIDQITQFGAQFISKGPVTRSYFKTENHLLRLDQGITAELIAILSHDHYQELMDASIPQHQQLKEVLSTTLGILKEEQNYTIRYHLKQVLIELSENQTGNSLLFLQAENLSDLKSIARQLSLQDSQRINE